MFLIFHFITRIMSACPYTSFNQSQLRSDNFFQEQTYIRGNPYAFGVWTQYAPIRQNQYSNYTKSLFNQEGNLDGVHILNFQSDNKIQTLYYQKWIYLTGYPSLVILQRTYDTIYKYSIQQSNYTYEGYWIFTYFSFKYDNQYNIALYNTGDNSFINVLATNRKLTTQTTNAKLEYGGQGQYKIGSSNYNLNIFPGRISIITIFENDIQFFNNNDKSKFYSFLSTCQIPSPCQQEYNIFFQTEPSSFENCTALQFNLEIPVVRFMFDLWIKRDMDILNSQKEIILSMGGQYLNRYTFYQMQILWRNVDKLVNLMHDMQLFTVVPSEITQENNQLKQITYLNQQKYQMDKWIYLSYEFQKIQNYSYVHLSIYQSCCDSWRKFKILETFNQSQYSNYKVKFTLFQGQFNMPNYIPFAGLISNFRVKFCYQGDLNFGKQYNLNCNAQCKTCKGPTKYDCTSCYDEQNRYFESEVQLCLCKRDFDETGSLICKKNFLSSILNGNNIQQEFLIQEFQLNQKCMFGYFEFWKNLTFIGCIQCPYFGQNQQSIRCVNCLLNSKTWYKLPICDLEYQSLDSVFYFDQKLDYITKELFIVNQELMVVELCKGCEQMVQQKSSRSVMINIDGSISIYQCKSFLYSKNDSCELCDTNCKICNDQGQCIQCFEGFYLKQNVCQKCPQECGLCEYNMENEILKCLSCQINYGLVDNQCIKCGYLCEICERRKYNFQEQEYLKCLKCYRNTFISLDGESCYYNKMSDCISPFQFKINSPWLNTLLHNFTPLEQNQIQTGCILYLFIISLLNVFLNQKYFNFQDLVKISLQISYKKYYLQ